ncbi:MAG: MerR family transcriptional regulator [Clostridiales bacterium]|jgi:DNA-binding transcriptional MerR regulator|nr:MerR family transcriptional regulator [Clostridiales bacterium]
MSYSIRQVAEKSGLNAHTLRYYENEGLLPHINRRESGIRCYSDDDLEWLGLICCLKNTGMSIRQIKAFVDLSLAGDETLQQRREMLFAHKSAVEAQIQEMYAHLDKISCKIALYTEKYDNYAANRR